MGRTSQLTVWTSLPDIGLHMFIAVLGASMAFSSKKELDILFRRRENGGQF
jgi:hypothetical protein